MGMPFQFTHPGKGATNDFIRIIVVDTFQFTHPGKGATKERVMANLQRLVSIHAPWEGCDCRGMVHRPDECLRFNSRTLGRVRHDSLYVRYSVAEFQFTHPGKGATPPSMSSSLSWRFQFTHPGKGATSPSSSSDLVHVVSIHAPWEGCDSLLETTLSLCFLFQFTHPGKGATHYPSGGDGGHGVSIHAPWEGCDRPCSRLL